MAVLALAYIGSAIGTTLAAGTAFAAIGGSIGMLAGSLIGQALFSPTMHSEGPRLGDLKTAAVTYGSVIPYLEGHPRLAGVLVWASKKREIATTTSAGGSGGGSDQTTYTYECDVIYMLSENEVGALRKAWKNGQLVWSNADDADGDTVDASAQAELWKRITFYSGAADQLPDATYEAAVGVGNAPAYRTRSTVFIEGLQLGNSGQFPNLTFEVVVGGAGGGDTGNGPVFEVLFDDGTGTDTGTSHLTPVHVGEHATFPTADGTGHMRCGHIGGGLSDSLVNWTGPSLQRPAATLVLIEFYTSWSALSMADHHIFEWFNDSGEYHIVSYYINSGILRWGHDGVDMEAPYRIPINTRTKIEMRFEPDGAGTLSIDGDLQISRTVDTSAYTTAQVILGCNLSFTYDYTVDNVRIWYGEPTPAGLVSLAEPTLQEVVERQCVRGGLGLDQIDASDLATRNVHAMVVSQITSPRGVIEMLAGAYLFSAVESGDTLRFKFLGGAPVADIPYADLIAEGEADALPITDANDLELPVQVFVKYMNLLDDYQDGSENSDRLVSAGQNTSSIELPLGFTPTQAKRISDMNLQKTVVEARRFGPFKLTRSYCALEPSDVVILHDADGNSYRARLGKESQATGVLTFDAVADHALVYTSHAETGTVGYTNSTAIHMPVQTDALLLDMPILRDADNNAGFYAAVKPHTPSTTFPGAMMFKSADGTTYEATVSVDQQSVFGTASTSLAAGPTDVFDEVNAVTVDMAGGTLSSSTRDALLAGPVNAMLVGSEVIQFRDAALVSPGVYTLAGLLRGRRGTEWAVGEHAEGESAALLGTTLRRVPLAASELHAEKQWKAVTVGRSVASSTAQPFTDNGVGLKPFAPVNLRRRTSADGHDYYTWDRRSRLACNLFTGAFPLGEDTEQYDCELLDDADNIIASGTVSAAQWTPGADSSTLGQLLAAPLTRINEVGGDLVGVEDGFSTVISTPVYLTKVDPDTGAVIARSESLGQRVLTKIAVGSEVYILSGVISPAGFYVRTRLLRIDALTMATLAEYVFPFSGDANCITWDGTSVWVVGVYSGKLFKHNGTTLALEDDWVIEAGNPLYPDFHKGLDVIAYDADTDSIWFSVFVVGTTSSFELRQWDIATEAIISSFPCVLEPFDLIVSGGKAYCIGTTTGESVIDGVGARVEYGLFVYDTATGAELAHIDGGSMNIQGLSLIWYGSDLALAFTNFGQPNRIKIISTSTDAVTQTFAVPYFGNTNLKGIGYAGGLLYVAGRVLIEPMTTYALGSNEVDFDGALLRVYQLSAVVGRGYVGELTL